MVRRDDLDAGRVIDRACSVIGRLNGLTPDESMAALHAHAVLRGVSAHTAALAVLAEWEPAGRPHRPIPQAQTYTASDKAGRVLVRWENRSTAHLSVSGRCSDDLAVRLRRAVEAALRVGATDLVIDTSATTGVTPGLTDVVAWTERRLQAGRDRRTVHSPGRDHGTLAFG